MSRSEHQGLIEHTLQDQADRPINDSSVEAKGSRVTAANLDRLNIRLIGQTTDRVGQVVEYYGYSKVGGSGLPSRRIFARVVSTSTEAPRA